MASALQTKINSYSPSWTLEMNDATPSTTPTVGGTSPNKAYTIRNLVSTIKQSPSNGDPTSYEFISSTTSALNSYIQQTSAQAFALTEVQDHDWTYGFWFKLNSLPTANAVNDLWLSRISSTDSGFLMSVTGSSYPTYPSRIAIGTTNVITPQYIYSTSAIVAGRWYYAAIRKTGSSGSNNMEFYLNGTLQGTITNSLTTLQSVLMIGRASGSALENTTWWGANAHLGSSSNFNAAAIAAIYATGAAGYETQMDLLPATYYNLKLNNTSGTSLADSSSQGWSTTLSGAPTWQTPANSISKGAIFLPSATWSGYNTNPTMQYTATHSIAFWYKKASAPASLFGVTYNYYDSSNNLDTYIGTDGKLYWRVRINGTAQTALTSSANICDNSWHHIVVTRNGTSAKLYVDGTLNSSTTYTSAVPFGGASSWIPFGGADTYWDDYAYWNSTELSAAQVAALAAGGVSSTNINVSSPGTMDVTTSTFVDPVITVTATVNLTYNSGVVGTASALAVDPAVTAVRNIVPAAEPLLASADIVGPTVAVTANINYSATAVTASSLMVYSSVATTKTVNVSATPLLASALMSARVYAGDSVQDSSYAISIRKITAAANNTGNSGFIIGATKVNNVVTITDSLALKANSGFPAYNKIIKAKFDSAHVSYITSGDVTPSNYFKVYVFTENPSTSFDTMTLANLPAKEYIYTTRLVDDGSSSQYYLDLTNALTDIRAHTYGIYLEIDTDTIGGGSTGTYYDRTEWTGSNLNNQLFYVLTSEFISAGNNAAVSTASADIVSPTVSTQKYVDVPPGVSTASATMVNPSVAAATSVNISATVLTASATEIAPTVTIAVNYTSDHFEADARTGVNDPVITAISNKTITATVLTASAMFEDPAHSIGEINETTPMTASAIFADPAVYIVMSKNIAANAMIANATIPNPAYNQQLNALINAQPLTVGATFVAPPQYVLLTDDIWYNRLAAQNVGITNYATFLKFFKQQTGQTNGTVTNDLPGETNNGDLTGTLTTGSADLLGRKAVRIQGLIDHNPGNYYPALTRKTWSLETSIKTTNANQVLAQGTTVNPDVSYDYWSGNITLVNGKISVNTNLGIDKNATPTYNSTSVIGTSNVADGNWHHVVVQHDGTRTQIWVDGQLDVQSLSFVAPNVPVPSQIGSSTSDFYTSVWSLSEGVLLSERELSLNYWAYLKYSPIQPTALTASAVSGNNIGKGSQKKAVMLYYWSTRSQDNPDFYYNAQGGFSTSTQREVSRIFKETGEQGEFDIDYGIQLSTWNGGTDGLAAQKYGNLNIYPVDITGKIVSPIVKQSKYTNITTASSGTGLTWPQSDGFRDSRYGYNRYIDVFEDIDLTDVDVILFRNYPDDQVERAEFMQDQIVDQYFTVYEKQNHDRFLASLRKAIDAGTSLLVTHAQLAVDLGIVDRVETVEQISDYGSTPYGNTTNGGDPRSQTLLSYANDSEGYYADSGRNNRFRLVNTVTGLTDQATAILKDFAYWRPGTNAGFMGITRQATKVELKPNGLLIGDEFVMNSTELNANSNQSLRKMLAVPSSNVKAGKAITKFSSTIYSGTSVVANPYADYVTSIAVEPGDSLNGTAVGGKIFVTFTDLNRNISNFLGNIGETVGITEVFSMDVATKKVLDYAISEGSITQEEYDKFYPETYDAKYENGQITEEEFNKHNYWTQDDWDLQVSAVTGTAQVLSGSNGGTSSAYTEFDNSKTGGGNGISLSVTKASNTRRETTNGSTTTFYANLPFFTLSVTRKFELVPVYVKSLLTRGLVWLADKTQVEGTVIRPTVMSGYATMVNPVVSSELNVTVNAQSMLSTATITQGSYAKDRSITVLPMTAQATITPKVTLINAPVMTASARLADNIEETVLQADQVVLYVLHTDAILYVREDVIK